MWGASDASLLLERLQAEGIPRAVAVDWTVCGTMPHTLPCPALWKCRWQGAVAYEPAVGCHKRRCQTLHTVHMERSGVTTGVTVCPHGLWLVQRNRYTKTMLYSEGVPLRSDELERYMGEWSMAKFLKVAKLQAAAAGELLSSREDWLFKGRPALEEFMLLIRDDEGKPREPSAVMIAMKDGAARVGLKDDQAGWCWREAKTVSLALDAIEKALQGTEACFRPSKDWNAAGAKNGGRRPR